MHAGRVHQQADDGDSGMFAVNHFQGEASEARPQEAWPKEKAAATAGAAACLGSGASPKDGSGDHEGGRRQGERHRHPQRDSREVRSKIASVGFLVTCTKHLN